MKLPATIPHLAKLFLFAPPKVGPQTRHSNVVLDGPFDVPEEEWKPFAKSAARSVGWTGLWGNFASLQDGQGAVLADLGGSTIADADPNFYVIREGDFFLDRSKPTAQFYVARAA